jgi:hypothetical protein
VVSTLRATDRIQSSVVNVGFLAHSVTERAGSRVRDLWKGEVEQPQGSAAGHHHNSATGGSGRPWRDSLDDERLRLLRREVFVAAGGTHDDWDEYDRDEYDWDECDRVMAEQGRAVVLIRIDRTYDNR